mgnify:CR=1 FL=1|jgi:O-antigen biosynthesis protein WbqP
MKRLFDIFFSLIAIAIFSLPIIIIAALIFLSSKGPPIYWSKRVGINNVTFKMPKFRTMFINTPDVASHLLKDPNILITPIGRILRKTSLDEIPQLYSILIGDMSFVGPRPALYNQEDLIKLRSDKRIDNLIPGLTGWSQINGRDELSIEEKVNYDYEYLQKRSLLFDIYIIYKTIINTLKQIGVSH